jgi:hypothetical protein
MRIIYSQNGCKFNAVKLDEDGRAEGRMRGTVAAARYVEKVLQVWAQGCPLERVERIPGGIKNAY